MAEKLQELPHSITLDSRSRLTATGVTEVESFDEQLAVVHTAKGVLVIRGNGLHLKELGSGQVRVDGTVDSLSYEDGAVAGGFFSRLFG